MKGERRESIELVVGTSDSSSTHAMYGGEEDGETGWDSTCEMNGANSDA